LNGVPSLAEDFPRFGCAFLVESLDPPSHAFFHAAPDCFPGVVGECSGPQSTLWTWIGALRLMSKKKRNSCLPNHYIFSSETWMRLGMLSFLCRRRRVSLEEQVSVKQSGWLIRLRSSQPNV
jgi:hypothetical protein